MSSRVLAPAFDAGVFPVWRRSWKCTSSLIFAFFRSRSHTSWKLLRRNCPPRAPVKTWDTGPGATKCSRRAVMLGSSSTVSAAVRPAAGGRWPAATTSHPSTNPRKGAVADAINSPSAPVGHRPGSRIRRLSPRRPGDRSNRMAVRTARQTCRRLAHRSCWPERGAGRCTAQKNSNCVDRSRPALTLTAWMTWTGDLSDRTAGSPQRGGSECAAGTDRLHSWPSTKPGRRLGPEHDYRAAPGQNQGCSCTTELDASLPTAHLDGIEYD